DGAVAARGDVVEERLDGQARESVLFPVQVGQSVGHGHSSGSSVFGASGSPPAAEKPAAGAGQGRNRAVRVEPARNKEVVRVRIGCHLSVANGFAAMVRKGVALGADVVQYFPKNPKSYRPKPFNREELE